MNVIFTFHLQLLFVGPMSRTILADCSPWINPGGSKGGWDVTDRTDDISTKVEMSFFYFRSIPKSP